MYKNTLTFKKEKKKEEKRNRMTVFEQKVIFSEPKTIRHLQGAGKAAGRPTQQKKKLIPNRMTDFYYHR